ncbi:MAG: hypothetical protein V1792_09080 [Pseudomonadota bacterium]
MNFRDAAQDRPKGWHWFDNRYPGKRPHISGGLLARLRKTPAECLGESKG